MVLTPLKMPTKVAMLVDSLMHTRVSYRRRFLRFGMAAILGASVAACGGGDTIGLDPEPTVVVTITPATPTVSEDGKIKLSAVVASNASTPPSQKVTWTSSNTAVATVVDSGVVSGVAPGVATITAAAYNGSVATVQVTVTISPCKVSQAAPITPGVLINGSLTSTDCDYDDGTFADAYTFSLPASTNVDILMRSSAFDAFLFVYVLTPAGLQELYNDNNSGGGNDARLTGLLTAGNYYILANSNNINGFGAYTLLLTSPFAGLNAGATMFKDSPTPIVVRRLAGVEALRFRALVSRKH